MWECSEDKTLPMGSWYLWTTGKTKVLFSCPLCGQIMFFGEEDGIKVSAEGIVSPVLKCPAPGCYFREPVKLVGWRPQDLPPDEDTKYLRP